MNELVRANGIWTLNQALKQYDSGNRSYYAMGFAADTLLRDIAQDELMRVLVDDFLVPPDRAGMVYQAYKFFLRCSGEHTRYKDSLESKKAQPVMSGQSEHGAGSAKSFERIPIAVQVPVNGSADQRYAIVRTAGIEKLVQGVEGRLKDWKEYVSKEELDGLFKEIPLRTESFCSAVGGLVEIILNRAVLQECEKTPGAYKYQPVQDGARFGCGHFFYKGGTLHLSGAKGSITEYDCVVLAQDIPVIFEAKSGGRRSMAKQRSRQVNHLCEYFGTTKAGYVSVRVAPAQKRDELLAGEQNGYTALSWYCSRAKFRDEVQRHVFGKLIYV